jgi:hypothetical protein
MYNCFAKAEQDYEKYSKMFPELFWQPYQNGQEMLDELCAVENGVLCNSEKLPNITAICEGETSRLIPERNYRKSSLSQLCGDVDRKKICNDAAFQPQVCPSGSAVAQSLC